MKKILLGLTLIVLMSSSFIANNAFAGKYHLEVKAIQLSHESDLFDNHFQTDDEYGDIEVVYKLYFDEARASGSANVLFSNSDYGTKVKINKRKVYLEVSKGFDYYGKMSITKTANGIFIDAYSKQSNFPF